MTDAGSTRREHLSGNAFAARAVEATEGDRNSIRAVVFSVLALACEVRWLRRDVDKAIRAIKE